MYIYVNVDMIVFEGRGQVGHNSNLSIVFSSHCSIANTVTDHSVGELL